jgi:hypothetical protein
MENGKTRVVKIEELIDGIQSDYRPGEICAAKEIALVMRNSHEKFQRWVMLNKAFSEIMNRLGWKALYEGARILRKIEAVHFIKLPGAGSWIMMSDSSDWGL